MARPLSHSGFRNAEQDREGTGSPRIAGTGLLALDVVIPASGSILASTFAGGTCGNVLSILSYFGWRAAAIAAVGNDVAGERVLADLGQWRLALERVVVDDNARTPVFVQKLEHDSEGRPSHSFATECPSCGGALNAAETPDVPAVEFTDASAPDFFFMDRLSPSIVSMAASAKRHGAIVVYEPSAESDRSLWGDALRLVNILKYAEDRFQPEDFEAHQMAGCGWEVQTQGARGLRFRQHGADPDGLKWRTLNAISAPRLVDTCGAGDWCTAGLLFGAAAKGPGAQHLDDPNAFSYALRVGQAYAAWACGFEGARGAMYATEAPETHRIATALLSHEDSLPDGVAQFAVGSQASGILSVCDAAHGRRPARES